MSYDQCIAIMAAIFLASDDDIDTALTRKNAIEKAVRLKIDTTMFAIKVLEAMEDTKTDED